jgi:hypothetical protein
MKELLGGCLLAAGFLIAGLTGTCMLIMLTTTDSWQAVTHSVGIMLSYAAVPLFIGIALIFAGRALIRSARIDDGRSF